MPRPAIKTHKENRLSIRANAGQKTILARAAKAQHMNVSQFVLQVSLVEAERIIREETQIAVSPEEYQRLCAIMDAHPRQPPTCAPLWPKSRSGMNDLRPPEPLNENHDVTAFDCGSPPLNEFLKLHALDKQKAMLSRTYAVTRNAAVVGYYTLAHASVLQPDVPKKLRRGMPSAIPAILMARFAVDSSWQGKGLGRSLFTDAIRRTWAVMHSGAAPVRLFIVDAKDEMAKAFYQRFDMISASPDSMRLYLSYKTLRTVFEE